VVIPERFVAFLFDDVSIRDSADLTRIRDAATRQLAALQPGDRASVIATSCRVLLDFTDDRAKLQEAVAQISFHASAVCRVAATQVPQLAVLASVVARMAHLPGQRSVILISPGFLVGHDRTAEEAQTIDAAIASKVLVDALDVGGVGGRSPSQSGDASARAARMPRANSNSPLPHGNPDNVPRQYAPPEPVTLTELAHGTGGAYVAAGNDLDSGFQKLATPESFYVLGFSPSDVKADGSFHELKVKLKDSRKLTVQARKGYIAGPRQ
jgi:VWFA-related protein